MKLKGRKFELRVTKGEEPSWRAAKRSAKLQVRGQGSSRVPAEILTPILLLIQALSQTLLPDLATCTPRQLVHLIAGFNRLGYYPGVLVCEDVWLTPL